MPDIALFDARRVSLDEARISAFGSVALFGNQAFERMRGFYDKEGRLRIRALDQHLERGFNSAKALFGPDLPDELKTLWRNWVIDAVKASEYEEPYIHLGFGQFEHRGAMLQAGQSGLGTFIFVKEAPPLYGDFVSLSSEKDWSRPTGPLVHHKISGNYADLLFFKNRARMRCPDDDPKCVESLLFTENTLYQDDPFVAELGCSNAFALNDNCYLILPMEKAAYFRGISIQIIESLFDALFPKGNILFHLRRSDLLQGGGAIGTATKFPIPVKDVDGEPAETNEHFAQLAAAYRDLLHGESEFEFPELQEKWAPVTEK